MFKFLNYLDKPFPGEGKTYKRHLIEKIIERV